MGKVLCVARSRMSEHIQSNHIVPRPSVNDFATAANAATAATAATFVNHFILHVVAFVGLNCMCRCDLGHLFAQKASQAVADVSEDNGLRRHGFLIGNISSAPRGR